MMKITELQESEIKELHRLSKFYWKEAERCKESKAYLAGCVMAGAALETLLIIMVDAYLEEALATNKMPKKIKSVLILNFSQLLEIAKRANWLPSSLNLQDSWNHKKARIGDYAEVIRMIRNLLHSSRFLNDHPHGRITKKHLELSLQVVSIASKWIYNKIAKSICDE